MQRADEYWREEGEGEGDEEGAQAVGGSKVARGRMRRPKGAVG